MMKPMQCSKNNDMQPYPIIIVGNRQGAIPIELGRSVGKVGKINKSRRMVSIIFTSQCTKSAKHLQHFKWGRKSNKHQI